MKLKRTIYFIAYVLWIVSILAFSLQTGEDSSMTSGLVVNLIADTLGGLNIAVSIEVLSLIIRKLAHFTEYMVLGYISHRNVKLSNQKGYYVSILLPFLDELLQTTIDGRAGRMLDVGIDLLGYFAGVSLALTLKPNDAQ